MNASKNSKNVSVLSLALTSLFLVACTEVQQLDSENTGDGGHAGEEPVETQEVALAFQAISGDEEFSCGTTFSQLGDEEVDVSPTDLRFFIHNVELTDSEGNRTPFEMENNTWVHEGTVLIDFENKQDNCQDNTGNPDSNTSIVGTVPAGNYTGVRFTLGVPFEQNHDLASMNVAPLSTTSMQWNWLAGYKFLRFEAQAPNNALVFHLGSTGCEEDMEGQVTGCMRPNRVDVELEGLDLDMNPTIVLDLHTLFENTSVVTADGDPKRCMSPPNDPTCQTLFAPLGLGAQGEQQVFRIQ